MPPEKFLGWTIKSLQVDTSKTFNITAWSWNNSYGELKSQEFNFEHENSLKSTIEGLDVDFVKNVNFNPWFD